MLSKAFEMIDNLEPFNFFKMTDAELINNLKKMGTYQYEIATRLKYRKLFKQVYAVSRSNLDEAKINAVKSLEDMNFRRKKEQELEESLNIPSGHVIIDVPFQELHQAEPRIDQTDIAIVDDRSTKNLDEYTPIAKAIRLRPIPDWIVMIIADEKYRDLIAGKAEKILFG
jgi:HD superfamily phosphohydrolase